MPSFMFCSQFERFTYFDGLITCTTGEEILPSDQKRLIQQTKFTYVPLLKAFENQTKTIGEQWRTKIDAFANQNKRLVALTNKYDRKSNYKETFENPVKEKIDKIKKLIYEIKMMI